MKTRVIILLALLFSVNVVAQVPQAMKYKAVAKDDWGIALPNKAITLQFTIVQGNVEVYREVHHTTTNKFGIMDVNIGQGIPDFGDFASINWSTGEYFIKIGLDPRGGSNFKLNGNDKLLSVPYALYAGNVDNQNDKDTDPGNELISNAYLLGAALYLVEGSQTTMVDLSSLQDGTEDADADPMSLLRDQRLRAALVRAIEALPEREQYIMSMYYEHDMNLKEIAAVLGVTESRVCQLHSQAIARLRTKMRPH